MHTSFTFSQHLPINFVGREDEVQLVGKYLNDPLCRLITLVGLGGAGKTLLAQYVASMQENAFPHGIVFVPLFSLVSSDYLIPTIAEALHFSFYNHQDLAGQLFNFLQEKQLLLILDGFEQVMASRAWLGDLLQSVASVKVLVTSREKLNLEDEKIITLQGMRLPSTHTDPEFDSNPAVRLFLNNARLLEPSYKISPPERSHVLHICQMVGGLPLAIQMAAAWTRAISCEQIVSEIERDMDFLRAPFYHSPERHQSLKVVFDHSWRMLSSDERLACRQLSVFVGSFSSEAAQHVGGASQEQLTTLVQKSLLQSEISGIYHQHATFRQYAAAQLSKFPDEESETHQRHMAYFCDFLRTRRLHLKSGQQQQALQEIAEVIDDARAAWRFAVQRQDFETLDRFAESLYLFFSIRSRLSEGLEVFDQASVMCQNAKNSPVDVSVRIQNYQATFMVELNDYERARQLLLQLLSADTSLDNYAFAHGVLARLFIVLNNHPQALQHGRQSLEIYERIQDSWGQAKALDSLGVISWTLGDFDSADQYFRRALTFYRQLDAQQGVAGVLDHLGSVARERRDYDRARKYFEESLAISRKLDARLDLAYVNNHLGGILAMKGDLIAAEPYFEECISIAQEIGERRIVAYTLSDWASALGGDHQSSERAQQLFVESLEIFDDIGDLFGTSMVRFFQGEVALKTGNLSAACSSYQSALRLALEIQNPRLIHGALAGFVNFLDSKQDYVAAVSLLTCLSSSVSSQLNELSIDGQALMRRFRTLLSPEEFEQAVSLGQEKTMDDYVTQLLELS